ncbi:MAG: hypothetical protein OQK09_15130 [Colwellia sp.]|nr:hypothetical protein [Colwellia sp.]MCW8863343.1 hypothetical protein [Colwellia sp.]MCW9082840.1 hypothetical protein [Colwellia sp.]
MKETNSYKIAIAATTLVMAYFASGIASIAQATELVKAEPIQEINLIQEAKDNLALSFSTLSINSNANTDNIETMIAEQKPTAEELPAITLSKVTLTGE